MNATIYYKPLFRRCIWFLFVSLLTVLMVACASVPDRRPVPGSLTGVAGIPEISGARFWADAPLPKVEERIALLRKQLKAAAGSRRSRQSILAISGGGDNGAFGAGLLVGWTKAGDRPTFRVVSGTSTGALIASFAFLGPEYDAGLKAAFTTITKENIFKKRGKFAALTGDAFSDTKPLQQLIARYVDKKMLDKIAAEYATGRRLFVGTTNLDADRPVIWDIGMIAASGHPKALELVRKVLLASSSIPVIFPPVYFDVEAEGKRYDEMHVDGGITSQVFVYPPYVDIEELAKKVGLKGMLEVYVIRNSYIEPKGRAVVPPKIKTIASSSISTLTRSQGVGDLYRIYLQAKRDNAEFYLAHIPSDFDAERKEQFDPEYMGKLFDLGYGKAKNGYPWVKAPPGFE